jgi:diguanylate cyclase (GGDEF)-like protein/PAS domain S-box-containing protein
MTDRPPPAIPSGPRPLDDSTTLRELVRNLRDGVYVADAEGRILDANPAFLSIVGIGTLDELRGRTIHDLTPDPARYRAKLQALEPGSVVSELRHELRRPDGEVRTVLDTISVVQDAESGSPYFHGILADLTAQLDLERELRDLAVRDPLTGCYNRRFLAELAQSLEGRGEPGWGCIFVDVDCLKHYNDAHGHQKGDEILVKMSRFLMRQVRAEEAVVRMGGDEFLVVLAGADESRTEGVARRLQLAAFRSAPAPFALGWAARTPGESFEHTVRRADQRLLTVQVQERALEQQRRLDT